MHGPRSGGDPPCLKTRYYNGCLKFHSQLTLSRRFGVGTSTSPFALEKEVVIPRRRTKWHELDSRKAFWLFVIFASLVFLMGGGSRYDIASVGLLRAVSAVFLAIAIWFQTRETLRSVAVPLGLLLSLAGWMAVQLIPLPFSVWSDLPGREQIAELDLLVGLGEISRPLTMSPLRTLNSLYALVVPLTALLLLSLLDGWGWRRLGKFLFIVGVVSAVLGILQVALRAPALYFYEITNSGSAVGLFSNRNHNALFLNVALLASLFRPRRTTDAKWTPNDLFWLTGQLLLLLCVLVNGSRFGLVMLAFVGGVFAVQMFMKTRSQPESAKGSKLLGGALAALSVLLVAAFASLERVPAIRRMFEQSLGEEMRGQSMPYLIQMAQDHLTLGVGFGAFEQAYRAVEPVDLLGPTYFNHAHNDWLQIVIEGGLPGVILLVVALVLIAWQTVKIWRARNRETGKYTLPFFGMFTLVLFAMHSVVDYPLRTPSLMVVAIIAIGMMFLYVPESDDGRLQRS